MGVGLYLNGVYTPPKTKKDPERAWLTKVEKWFDEEISGDQFWGNFFTRCRHGTTHDDRPALFVFVHPAAEDLEFSVLPSGCVRVMTKTSTVGPGYHTALCQLLHRFGTDLKVTWHPEGEEDHSCQDETGYFFTGDRAAVEKEMLQHLKTIAQVSLEHDHDVLAWNMPMGHTYTKGPPGVRTPLGIRSRAWVEAVAEDPQHGVDIYPWWEDGLGADFRLGRALCEMWSNIRWAPVLDDDEMDQWESTLEDLQEAYEIDPTHDYPWREWVELWELISETEGSATSEEFVDEVLRPRAKTVRARQPLVGYRRHPVSVDLLDGWRIEIPGAMKEQWDKATFSGWDGERTVWFDNWSVRTKEDTPVPAAELLEAYAKTLPEGEAIYHQNEALIGKAVLTETEENEKSLRVLKTASAIDGKVALCSIYYVDEKDDAWAIATWHSISAQSDKD